MREQREHDSAREGIEKRVGLIGLRYSRKGAIEGRGRLLYSGLYMNLRDMLEGDDQKKVFRVHIDDMGRQEKLSRNGGVKRFWVIRWERRSLTEPHNMKVTYNCRLIKE